MKSKNQSDGAKARAAKKRAEERAARRAERIRIKSEKRRMTETKRGERSRRRKKLYAAVRKKLQNPPNGFAPARGFAPLVELICEGDITSAAVKLSASGLRLSDIRREGKTVRFKIRKKDMRKAIAILDEMCYNYRMGETFGAGRKLSYMLSRFGLLAGGIACAAALYLSYGYIWRLELFGNERITDAELLRALGSAGIRIGAKRTNLNAKLAAAVSGLDGIADASVEAVGTRVRVRVLEAADFTEKPNYTSYVSAYDASVTRITVRSGTPKVKRGDNVRAGEVLATGEVYGTDGELLYSDNCDCDVFGEVSVSVVAELSPVSVSYVRTGKTKTVNVFTLFGGRIGKARSPYASYEVVSRTSRYDILVPLYVTAYTYYETHPEEQSVDIDGAVKAFASQKTDELGFFGSFDYTYTVKDTVGGLKEVHLIIEGEALISKGVA